MTARGRLLLLVRIRDGSVRVLIETAVVTASVTGLPCLLVAQEAFCSAPEEGGQVAAAGLAAYQAASESNGSVDATARGWRAAAGVGHGSAAAEMR